MKRRLPALVIALGVVVVAGLGVRWWLFARTHVQTDDAYVHADIAFLNPRVAGSVRALLVDENWQVERGDVLVQLDPTEYRVRLRRAEAAVARAVEGVEQARAAVRAADAEVQLAETELAQARDDAHRAQQLAGRGALPSNDADHARTALRTAELRRLTAQRAAERARATLGIPLDAPARDAAVVREAEAARDEAALELRWTKVRAPVSGVVTKRAVEAGQRVQPGQALLAIVPIEDAYVEANFKETQLGDVHVGQPVTIVTDVYPGYEYHGHVDGIAPGTGSAFALLPPENATGNWVKVVQRLPVRVRLDRPAPAARPLRIGTSVVATIDTRDRSGPLLTPRTQSAARAAPPDAAAGL